MKYTLDLEEGLDYDFKLIGLSCHAKDYRVSWCLNRFLNMQFVKEEDLTIVGEGLFGDSHHSVYSYFDEENQNQYHLICNRDSTGFLLPEQKQADYVIMIKESLPLDIDYLIEQIRSIDLVLTSFEIDVSSLKSKQNLIL